MVHSGDGDKFRNIRNRIFSSFLKHDLEFKVYGGAAINIIDRNRITEDLNIVIKKTMVAADKFVNALVDCEYGTSDEIYSDLFGADPRTEMYLFSTNRIRSSNVEYGDFYIDLTFEFGSIIYEDVVTEVLDVDGLKINVATQEQLLSMKRKIKPVREKDIKDIQLLENRFKKSSRIKPIDHS